MRYETIRVKLCNTVMKQEVPFEKLGPVVLKFKRAGGPHGGPFCIIGLYKDNTVL